MGTAAASRAARTSTRPGEGSWIAHAIAGDTDTAVTTGHQAINAVTALHSPRAYDKLRVLNTVLEPLHTSAGVAELCSRLAATVA